jgi:hypothetical protein
MVFLSNPPVEDAAGGGAEPIFLGLCSKNNPQNIKHMPPVIFFACLFLPYFLAGDLEQKSSFMDGHYLVF